MESASLMVDVVFTAEHTLVGRAFASITLLVVVAHLVGFDGLKVA